MLPNSLPRDAGAAEGEASSSSSEEAALRPVRLLECCPASLLKRGLSVDQSDPYALPASMVAKAADGAAGQPEGSERASQQPGVSPGSRRGSQMSEQL